MQWEAVSAIAAALAAAAAFVAAYFSYKQTKTSATTVQVQAFQNVFQEIRQQEREFYVSLSGTSATEDRDRPFFNTIEYLAFLLRRGILEQRYFREFYQDAFLDWWQLFEKHVPDHVRDDPAQYPEFKLFVQTLKKQNQ